MDKAWKLEEENDVHGNWIRLGRKEKGCFVKIYPILILAASLALPAHAEWAAWNELITTVVTLEEQGRYSEAAGVAEEALRVARDTFDPDDPAMVTSLLVLASIYTSQGNYTDPKALYLEALAIIEDNLGPDHPHVATIMEKTARFYKKAGREAEARRLEEQAKRIRSRKK